MLIFSALTCLSVAGPGVTGATWRSVIFAGEGGDEVNIAQQDRIAQREHTCPRCGAEPGKSCWEKARGNPGRKTYMARPHAERAELVQEEPEALRPRAA